MESWKNVSLVCELHVYVSGFEKRAHFAQRPNFCFYYMYVQCMSLYWAKEIINFW